MKVIHKGNPSITHNTSKCEFIYITTYKPYFSYSTSGFCIIAKQIYRQCNFVANSRVLNKKNRIEIRKNMFCKKFLNSVKMHRIHKYMDILYNIAVYKILTQWRLITFVHAKYQKMAKISMHVDLVSVNQSERAQNNL